MALRTSGFYHELSLPSATVVFSNNFTIFQLWNICNYAINIKLQTTFEFHMQEIDSKPTLAKKKRNTKIIVNTHQIKPTE